MKQKRTKPRPISKKRWSTDRWDTYLEHAEHEDWVYDCELREYKKSDKYKQGQDLAEQFKKKNEQ